MKVQTSHVQYFREISDCLKICRFPFESTLDGFVIYKYDDVELDSWIHLPVFRQNFYEICLEITQGCNFSIDQFEVPVSDNRLSFISPHRLYSIEPKSDDQKPLQGFSILFTQEFLGGQPANGQFFTDFPFFNHFNSPFISLEKSEADAFTEVFTKIYQEYKSRDGYSKDIILHYLNVLFLLGKRLYRNAARRSISVGREQEIYSEFEWLLQKSFLELNTVKDYAEKIHVSPKHLSETIKKVSGESALQLIHKAQVNYAKGLLLQTNMTISQIAEELHFENPEYFSVFFKRLTGKKPLEFRVAQY
jgi:AraC family transcriptional regulator, transcriptional activator of pobA